MTVFFSGCEHHCEGCHNPLSHDFQNGRPFTDEVQNDLIEYIRNTPYIDGITLSGGDPMYSSDMITPFVKRLRLELPETSVWVYSGFLYEQIISDESMRQLLAECDVLIDGPFIQKLKHHNLVYKGSTNQRIIDIQKSLSSGTVVLWNE